MAMLRVREIRQKIDGLTIEQLSADVGISVSQMSRIERGEREPKATELTRIADRLGQSVGALFGEDTPRRVPLLSWVSAGRLSDASSQLPVEDVPLLAFSDLGSGDFFALRVQGDSMDRISPDGSIIVIDRQEKTLQANKPYVFAIRGEATYKLWRPKPPRLEPYSTNPTHSTIFIERQNELEIVGRVRRTLLDL